jgi:hypothetical protein
MEFRAGTVPTDTADLVKIVGIVREEDGAFVLRFRHAASRQYAIDYSSDLASWSRVENPTLIYYTATGIVIWRDDGSQTGGLAIDRFYRITVP